MAGNLSKRPNSDAEAGKDGIGISRAYVQDGKLYVVLTDNRTLQAGWVKGDKGDTGEKGDTGDSGVHFGTEAPTDPEKVVWIDPTGQDGMREVVNILSRLKYTAGGVQVDLSDYMREDRGTLTLYEGKDIFVRTDETDIAIPFTGAGYVVEANEKDGIIYFLTRDPSGAFAWPKTTLSAYDIGTKTISVIETIDWKALFPSFEEVFIPEGYEFYACGVSVRNPGCYTIDEDVVATETGTVNFGGAYVFNIDINKKRCVLFRSPIINADYDVREAKEEYSEEGYVIAGRTTAEGNESLIIKKRKAPENWDTTSISGWSIGEVEDVWSKTLREDTNIWNLTLIKCQGAYYLYEDAPDLLWKFDSDGTVLWEKSAELRGDLHFAGDFEGALYFVHSYATTNKAYLTKIWMENGETCWKKEIRGEFYTKSLCLRDGKVFTLDEGECRVIDCKTGMELTTQPMPTVKIAGGGPTKRFFKKDKMLTLVHPTKMADAPDGMARLATDAFGTTYNFK